MASLSLGACLEATPFGVNPSETDITQRNLEELGRTRPGSPLRFAALGDVHNEYDDLARTVDALNARDDISFVAIAGDISDRGLLQEMEWVHEILDRLNVPYFTAVGNHDVLSSGKQVYQRMFGPFDYRFRYGGFEFVFYNSNYLEFPGEPVPNFEWLDEQLTAADDADGIVMVAHTPPTFPPRNDMTTASRPPAEGFPMLLAKHDVSLLVHSHLKDYEVMTERGVPILQCGTFEVYRYYTVVTIARGLVLLERCHFSQCEPVFNDGLPVVP